MMLGRIHPFAIALLTALVGAFDQRVFAQESGGDRRDSIVAKVNDDFVTTYEVMKEIGAALESIQANDTLSAEDKHREWNKLFWSEVRKQAEERLILQAAKKLGIQISEERVELKIQEQVKEAGGMENLLKILGDQGLEFDEFQDSFRRKLTRDELLLRKFGLADSGSGARAQVDVYITPREIRDFYSRNKEDQYREPARVKLRWIGLFGHRVGNPQAAKDLADSIVLQLRQGADFEALAKEYSHGPNARDGGGWPTERTADGQEVWTYLTQGRPGRETSWPAIEQVAFNLPAGSISDPITLDMGDRKALIVLQIVDSIPARELSLRDVQLRIRDDLWEKKVYKNVERIKRELLRDAYIWPPSLLEAMKGD